MTACPARRGLWGIRAHFCTFGIIRTPLDEHEEAKPNVEWVEHFSYACAACMPRLVGDC